MTGIKTDAAVMPVRWRRKMVGWERKVDEELRCWRARVV
jgi:hypothetical protein